MTLKVNVKLLAEKNPIGTLCAATKRHTTVGVILEKECIAEKTEHDDKLS